MGYGTESSLFGIVAAVLGIVLILTVVLRMWKKVPQDKAGVVTGMKKRVITGGGGLVIPVFERIDYISLGNIPLSVATRSSLSSQGVPISVITTAVIKVRNEKNSILTAIEQFTGRNEKEIIDNIQGTAIAVLEGKLREIIATMTVEELYQKREEFSSRVQEVVGTELGNMGLEVKNFTITDISDENGYIKALGDGMIAQRKKDAEIQKAEAARDMQIKTSQARQEGESAKLKAEADIAQAAKDKAVLEANYMQEQQTAQAKAELAHDIQSNITQKDVIQAQMDAELLKLRPSGGIELCALAAVAHIDAVHIAHQLQSLILADVLVERAAEIIGDVILTVGKGACAAEAAHNGAALTLDAGLDLVSVDGAVALFQAVACLNDGNAQGSIPLRQLVGRKNAARACADYNDIILHIRSSRCAIGSVQNQSLCPAASAFEASKKAPKALDFSTAEVFFRAPADAFSFHCRSIPAL